MYITWYLGVLKKKLWPILIFGLFSPKIVKSANWPITSTIFSSKEALCMGRSQQKRELKNSHPEPRFWGLNEFSWKLQVKIEATSCILIEFLKTFLRSSIHPRSYKKEKSLGTQTVGKNFFSLIFIFWHEIWNYPTSLWPYCLRAHQFYCFYELCIGVGTFDITVLTWWNRSKFVILTVNL